MPSRAFAQFETGAVLGQIKDDTGAVVPGASVTLLNIETGVATQRVTDAEGGYEFFTVRPGAYKVSAELAGFTTTYADNVRVSVGNRQRVDLTMKVGALAEAESSAASGRWRRTRASTYDARQLQVGLKLAF